MCRACTRSQALIRRTSRALAGAAVFALLGFVGSNEVDAAFPGSAGLIVFVSERGFDVNQFWTARPGSKYPLKLTRDPDVKTSPKWSPDGRRLAYQVAHNGSQVMVLDPATGRRLLLTSGRREMFAAEPAWAPDGSRVVFWATDRRSQQRDLFIATLGGRSPRRVQSTQLCETEPAWAPDGRSIAFTSRCRGTPPQIFVSSAVGAGQPRLLTPGEHPSWSPDGSRIAFVRDNQLLVLDVAGGEETVLVASDAAQETPAWAPDGSALVFTAEASPPCDRSYGERLELIDLDGRNRRMLFPLYCTPANEFAPDWQPVCTRYGTTGRDKLVGTPGRDVLCALDGDDTVYAGAGDDVIIGGNGNDTIYGGPGKDRLFGSLGNDRLVAADDTQDVVDGGPGRDRATVDGTQDLVAGIESRGYR